MKDTTTTVQDLKKMAAAFVGEREWGKYHRPKNLAMSIAIEAGELMELFQWLDQNESDVLLSNARSRKMVADEMADVLAFLLSLSNATGIDLAASFESKMAHNARKYPVAEVRGHYKRPKKRE
ncbi:MAG: nucleotide pyrophosphohydrolase [bacterium]